MAAIASAKKFWDMERAKRYIMMGREHLADAGRNAGASGFLGH